MEGHSVKGDDSRGTTTAVETRKLDAEPIGRRARAAPLTILGAGAFAGGLPAATNRPNPVKQ